MISQKAEGISLLVEGITKKFGGVRALDGVNLSFSQAGLVALVGPNGAGKTTLINIISGFMSADSGRWFVNDKEATSLPSYCIARLGLVRTFQEVRIIRSMSVLDNVSLAVPTYGYRSKASAAIRSQAIDLLASLEIVHLLHHDARALSYGQQKLLSLACCLATKASILICDEPLAGVDPVNAERIAWLLSEYARENRLVIFIEHDIALVKQLAQRVVVLDHGFVIADGPPAQIFNLSSIAEAFLG